MVQTWRDLLFAHWPLAPEKLRALVPRELTLDVREGLAWVGLIPFTIVGLRRPFLPAIPGISNFHELNVRTYVTVGGKPGVYFFSLDAANLSAVRAARWLYKLPYFHARMSLRRQGGWISYQSRRRNCPLGEADFRGRYRSVGEVWHSCAGSLEHWLTERYCLYTVRQGRVYRAEIHHLPWPLQDAELELELNKVAQADGIELPDSQPVLQFARELKVLVWPLRRIL